MTELTLLVVLLVWLLLEVVAAILFAYRTRPKRQRFSEADMANITRAGIESYTNALRR